VAQHWTQEGLWVCVCWLHRHSLGYPQRCDSEDLQYSEASKHVLKCYRRFCRQAGLLPCSAKLSITPLQALGKAGQGALRAATRAVFVLDAMQDFALPRCQSGAFQEHCVPFSECTRELLFTQ